MTLGYRRLRVLQARRQKNERALLVRDIASALLSLNITVFGAEVSQMMLQRAECAERDRDELLRQLDEYTQRHALR